MPYPKSESTCKSVDLLYREIIYFSLRLQVELISLYSVTFSNKRTVG